MIFEVGLEIVILKKQLCKKPGQIISPGAQRSCFSSSSQNTEHCRTHQELSDFLGVEGLTRVAVSSWRSRPLVPQSVDEAGVPWPWPVCAGGTGSLIPAYTPST